MEHLKQKDLISLKDTFSFDCGVFCFSLLSTILLMLSTCLYVGVAFFNLNSAQVYSWITFPYAITIAICSAILFCFIYVLVAILYKKINQSVNKAGNQAKIIPLKESVKKHFMFLFPIIFICWLPWIIAHYPGSLDQSWVDEQVSFFSQFLSEGIDSNEAQLRDSKTTEGLAEPESLEPIRNVVYTYEKILNYTPIRFLNSPAFFVFYFPFFILCFALSKYAKNNRSKMLLALIPSFLIIASIIAGPLVLDRYCLPGLFIAALVISLPWIFISKESKVTHSAT